MYLITGASGQLGKLAAQFVLNTAQPQEIAVLSRRADQVGELAQQGALVRIGDYGHYESLVAAFSGVKKLLFISSNDLEHRALHHKNVVHAAKQAGVEEVVFTSFQHHDTDAGAPMALLTTVYAATENLLKTSGLKYTILRNGIYLELLPAIIGPDVKTGKTIFVPATNAKVAFTAKRDLAAAAAKVLLGSGFENKVYDLVNTEALTFSEIALLLSAALGTKIDYVSPSTEAYQQALAGAGLPPQVVGLFTGIAGGMATREFETTNDTLKTILGRSPVSVKSFLNDLYS